MCCDVLCCDVRVCVCVYVCVCVWTTCILAIVFEMPYFKNYYRYAPTVFLLVYSKDYY